MFTSALEPIVVVSMPGVTEAFKSVIYMKTPWTDFRLANLVLATGPNLRVDSGSSSTRTRTIATGLTTQKTQTIGNGPVLPPKTWHFKFTILAPSKYLSSDRIATWWIHRLGSFRRSFSSCIQICNRTNIHCVTIENPRISLKIGPYFTATQQYQSNDKSGCWRWKSLLNCAICVFIMSRYDQSSET